MCPKHHIPLVVRGGSTRKLCRLCKKRRLSHRNVWGICVDCQREMHLQSPRADGSKGVSLACPACIAEHTSDRKAAAARKNGKLGGPPMSNRLCQKCKRNRLAPRNTTGICRECQRIYGSKPKLDRATDLRPVA